jgi:fructose transport system substrate-binding protein
VAAAAALVAEPGFAQDVRVCLITKTDTNPFFVKMREGAQAKADELGAELTALAGREEGDNEGQVLAMESCIANGVDGILIVPTDSSAIVRTVRAASDSGIFVIALDTPLDPTDTADATLATDNFRAGELIGQWARARLGDEAARAKIAYLDLLPSQPTVDVLRNQGFMRGFGIDLGDPRRIGDERDPRNVCHDANEQRRGRAMRIAQRGSGYRRRSRSAACRRRNTKHQRPSARNACCRLGGRRLPSGNVAAGVIGATAQQYPLVMASMGVEAIAKFVATGERPAPTPGRDFFNTGVVLVTDDPVAGIESIGSDTALERCWG